MELSNSNDIKIFLTFEEIEAKKKFLIFSQKKAVLTFREKEILKNYLYFRKRKTLKNRFLFQETELFYIFVKVYSEP